MENNKKILLTVVGIAILVVFITGVTIAFFNYTRTGEANTIRVGRIAFNTTQASGQDGSINLSNAFPITRTLAATDNTNTGEVEITITGDTSYSGGVEYLVTATDVSNTVNSKTVPISIIATASNGLGSSDDSYFTNRGGNNSIYKVLANETVSNDDQLLVGYIAPDNNQTGVNGTITIRAYLDSDLVAISDTYNNGNTPTDNLGTPASFGKNKTVLATSEWNSLRTNGVSFKVKVEANEGIWVQTINTMYSFPTSVYNRDISPKVKEIYFNRMSTDEMHAKYDAATIKADLTYNNQGEVLSWLETNSDDDTKYNLIVASNGDTYITKAGYLFYDANLEPEKIVFNNINTSKITDMQNMFYRCRKLKSIDITSFDTSNVTTMYSMFSQNTALEYINMSNLDLRKLVRMQSIFADDTSLTAVNLSGVKMRDIKNMSYMFHYCSALENINLDGLGGDNLNDIGSIILMASNVKHVSMKNFNFGNASLNSLFADHNLLETIDFENANMERIYDVSSIFSGCSNLENVNLTGVDMKILQNASYMFYGCTSLQEIDLSCINSNIMFYTNYMFSGCSSLEKIYVSNGWNVDRVNNSNDMFNNCTSLVGGNGTVYDANHIAKEYAKVDGGISNPGYLTLKS